MSRETFWSSVSLNKNQICWLEELSKDAKFTRGGNLSRAAVMRTMLRVARKLNLDVSGVKSEEELKLRFLTAFRQYK